MARGGPARSSTPRPSPLIAPHTAIDLFFLAFPPSAPILGRGPSHSHHEVHTCSRRFDCTVCQASHWRGSAFGPLLHACFSIAHPERRATN